MAAKPESQFVDKADRQTFPAPPAPEEVKVARKKIHADAKFVVRHEMVSSHERGKVLTGAEIFGKKPDHVSDSDFKAQVQENLERLVRMGAITLHAEPVAEPDEG